MIRLEHEIEFPFENVSSPSKQVAKIIQFKEKYSDRLSSADEIKQGNQENISLLSEALGEVVKEYLEKKSSTEKNREFDEDSYLN
ncbi:hypothetical protein KKG31_05430 [Patescibacteria group bacterium]|nr:hypothetical protein [Patescibacteria group bacterium]MBU1758550.1 hypothetical protein [Patescibacteria group bacterium]